MRIPSNLKRMRRSMTIIKGERSCGSCFSVLQKRGYLCKMELMYYEFLVTHLDAPFLLLSAVTTGLIIRIFYDTYMRLQLYQRVLISISLYTINSIIIIPSIVFFYRWIMICGFYNNEGIFQITVACKNAII